MSPPPPPPGAPPPPPGAPPRPPEAPPEGARAEAPPELPAEATRRLSNRVAGLSCPNCGGALTVASGLRVVECPYCGTPLLATSEVGIRRFAVEPQVDSGRARELAREWLVKGVAKDPKLRTEAEIGEAFLTFLPFFRVEADCVGFALGTEERTRWVGSGKNRRRETYEVDVERGVQRSFDATYPAANVAEWGIQRVDLRGDPLVPFDADALDRRGMVFPPTGSEREVFAAAVESFRHQADPASGLKRVRFRFLESLRERLSVIYYPLWVVRYRFRERSYQVLVDAEDGTLAYGKAPGNDFYRALMLVLTQAVAAFAGTTVAQLFRFSPEVMVFAAGVGLGIVWWGWRRFRYGGVVIEGSGSRAEPGLARSVQSVVKSRRVVGTLADMAAGRLPGSDR